MLVGREDAGLLAADRLRVGLVSLLAWLLLGREDAWSLHSLAHCSMLRDSWRHLVVLFLFKGTSGGHRSPVVSRATLQTCLMILNQMKSAWYSNAAGFLLSHLQCLRKL